MKPSNTVVIGVLILVVLGAAGWYYYSALSPSTKTPTTNGAPTPPASGSNVNTSSATGDAPVVEVIKGTVLAVDSTKIKIKDEKNKERVLTLDNTVNVYQNSASKQVTPLVVGSGSSVPSIPVPTTKKIGVSDIPVGSNVVINTMTANGTTTVTFINVMES